MVETYDWHSIVQLESKRVYAVINKNYITKATLVEYSQVFNVKVWIASANAARTEVTSLDQSTIWIKIINDRICVLLLGRREDYNLEVLVCSFEALSGEWSDVDASQNRLRLLGELNRDHDVGIVCLDVIHAVYQRLI